MATKHIHSLYRVRVLIARIFLVGGSKLNLRKWEELFLGTLLVIINDYIVHGGGRFLGIFQS